MTDLGFEFEEPQPVAASHLLRCACCVCGHETLADPAYVAMARCARCMPPGGAVVGGGIPPPARGGFYALRPAQRVVDVVKVVPPESVCPVFAYGQGAPECGHEAPAPVGSLAGLALDCGWLVARGHSRGGVMGGNGRQLAAADMWSVRFRRPGWQAYAVRRGAAWSSVALAGDALHPFMAAGVTDLKEWLQAGGAMSAEWYAAIVKREADKATRTKAAAKARTAEKGTGSGARRESGG